MRKTQTGPIHLRSASGSYGWHAYRQADEIRLDYEILKILYTGQTILLNFYFVYSSAMLLIMLEVHFSLLFSNKAYFRGGGNNFTLVRQIL